MPILHILLVLVVVGLVLWLITTFLPIDARIKNIIVVVAIVLIVVWIIQILLGGTLMDVRVGRSP